MKVKDYMAEALKEARAALFAGEVPVGAIIVNDGEIIARSGNRCEQDRDPTAHAEILAIREAARRLGDWRLNGCTMYVTLEPCCMCAGAIKNARLSRVVFGAFDPVAGCCGSRADICALGCHAVIVGGILKDECAALLADCFQPSR
ncbi:MAG: nucleoside deaminase [Christensenellales bacterium]|jgi:tRNA(adenine34) deaminase